MRSHPLDIVLFFDTEDTLHPAEVGNDDGIKQIADILGEEGVPGVFLVIGDRAELLAARGRADVIESVRRHEVGLHTRSGLHPTGPEYVAGKSWEDGLAESLRHEREGAAIIERVFGKKCCALSTHWRFASPHAQRAAAVLGLPYVYAFPAAPPLYSLSWYCGALGIPWYSPTRDGERFVPYFEFNEDWYHQPAVLDAQFARLDANFEECLAAGHPYVTFMAAHPQRMRLAEFIDDYLTPNGHNLPREARGACGWPRRWPPDVVAANFEGFRRTVRWVKNHPRLRPTTLADVVSRYGEQPASITAAELAAAAAVIAGSRDVPLHERFSPAELAAAFAEALDRFDREGSLPREVARREVMGPTRNPVFHPEVPAATWVELLGYARAVLEHVERTGHLPHGFGAPPSRVGISHLYAAFADAYRAIAATGRPPETVELRTVHRYPELAVKIGQRFMEVAEGDNIDPDLDVDALYRHGKLQTWTLKPALLPP